MTAQLSALTFMSPAMLAGGALVALPVIAHLLGRRARRRIVFPTIELLSRSRASVSKLYRLRRLLMLILRCLAVLLIVAAFARPRWFEHPVATAGQDRGAAVVLLLDVSASVSQQNGGAGLYRSMAVLADRTIDELTPGRDRAAVVYASARPRSILPELTDDFQALRNELKLLNPTYHRADLPAAVTRAAELLSQHDGQRQLVIFSDMQERNWTEAAAAGASLPEDTMVTIVPVGSGDMGNVALSRPQMSPTSARVHRPVQLRVQAGNYSGDIREVTVRAEVNGAAIGEKTVSLQPWASREVVFDATLDGVGTHRVVFSIGPDALQADNTAYLAAKAVDRLSAAVVSEYNPHEPGTAAYFLMRALAPHGDARDELAVRHIEAAALEYGRIADTEAVFITDAARLDDDALEAVRMFTQHGGGVAMFCGDGPVRENLSRLTDDRRHSIRLPWMPVAPRDLEPVGGFLRLSGGHWDKSVLGVFDDHCRDALCNVRFFRAFAVEKNDPEAIDVLRFDDGTPAMSSMRVGPGRLVLCNFSPALGYSEIGKYGGFVALMHAMFEHLRPTRQRQDEHHAGEGLMIALTQTTSGANGLRAVAPDGKATAIDVSRSQAAQFVQISRPDLTGFYEILGGEDAIETMAVNLHPAESDLRRIETERVSEQLSQASGAVTVRSASEGGENLDLRGRELWHWFALAALGVIALELMLLCIWKR